jgi:hypothetical protein
MSNDTTARPSYWEERYQTENTPWDIGYASPALIDFCQHQLGENDLILIPGAGRAHEAGKLWELGYRNVYVVDWSPSAIKEAQSMFPDIPKDRFIESDFFGLDMAPDAILEQTFFCAIPVEMRERYAAKVAEMLEARSGQLAGVFFDRVFDHVGPPHGGSRREYKELFEQYFNKVQISDSPLSIGPRAGFEAFIILSEPKP